VAYKAAIVSLEKRGYTLTQSDPQTGIANLELHSVSKLPEEDKQVEAANAGPSAGTIILVVLSIILVVGIIILLTSSSDDSKDKQKKEDKKDDTKLYAQGRDGGVKKSTMNESHNEIRHDDIHNEHHGY